MALGKLKEIYEKKYKLLLIITLLMFIFSISILCINKLTTGEFLTKDVSLKGGLMLTVKTDKEINVLETESLLAQKLNSSVSIKRLQSLGGGSIGYSIIVEPMDVDVFTKAFSEISEIPLTEENYTIETVSSALGAAFWSNTIKVLLFAFFAMAVVVILYFRKMVPAFAVILAATSDILCTLAIASLLGIKLSIGGVAALLMLIGYSVDTDILLSTKMLKREGALFERIYSSIKTGLTMQSIAIIALLVLYFVTPSEVLKQIAFLIIIGLCVDIPNTWIQNVGILRWYLERHGSS
ncbi:MAG: protein translocase subunit SecF [Candidatus Nanoarchaeia archaeon]